MKWLSRFQFNNIYNAILSSQFDLKNVILWDLPSNEVFYIEVRIWNWNKQSNDTVNPFSWMLLSFYSSIEYPFKCTLWEIVIVFSAGIHKILSKLSIYYFIKLKWNMMTKKMMTIILMEENFNFEQNRCKHIPLLLQ